MTTLTIHNFLGRGGVNGVGWESVQEPADDDRGRQRLCAPTGISMQRLWTSERISTLRPNDQLGANQPPPPSRWKPSISSHNFTFFKRRGCPNPACNMRPLSQRMIIWLDVKLYINVAYFEWPSLTPESPVFGEMASRNKLAVLAESAS